MSSQYGEHVRINEYFARRMGKFLDVGAYDGITFSNTYELYLAGWEGVLIEPSPEAFCRLKKAYRDDRGHRCALICAALDANNNGLEGIFESECYPVSTAYAEHYDKFKQYPHTDITVGSFTWDTLKIYHKHFDFINIDAEGGNLSLLETMPYSPSMVCVELDPREEELTFRELLEDCGLKHQEIIGGNLLAWK